MKEIKFTVTDPLGIHARPAGIRQELRYEKAPCSDGHGCQAER